MGLVAPEPGYLAGLRERCTAAGALLVFDEVITGFRVGPAGRAGPLRVRARPLDLRQGRRRRAPARRASAARPRSWTSWRRSAPCTRPARSRGTRSPPRPGSRCSRGSTRPRTTSWRRRRARLEANLRDACAAAGVAAQVTRVATLVGLFFAPSPGRRLRRRPGGRPRALRAVLPRPARPWRVLRSERLRDAVRLARARRRGRRGDGGRAQRTRSRRACASPRRCGAGGRGPCRRATRRTART